LQARRQQFRLVAPHIEGEIAGQQSVADALGHTGIVVQRDAGGAATGRQVAVAVVDQRAQRGGRLDRHARIVPQCGVQPTPFRANVVNPLKRARAGPKLRDPTNVRFMLA
jgi:hypothetical protein